MLHIVGWLVGWFLRSFFRWLVPSLVGSFVCCFVGWLLGSFVGSFVGLFVGWLVGWVLAGRNACHSRITCLLSKPTRLPMMPDYETSHNSRNSLSLLPLKQEVK